MTDVYVMQAKDGSLSMETRTATYRAPVDGKCIRVARDCTPFQVGALADRLAPMLALSHYEEISREEIKKAFALAKSA